MIQTLLHYGCHFIIPLGIALWIYPKRWKYVYLVFIGSMAIDLDHLWATPIFDSSRCSVGFHALHSYTAIVVYGILLIPKHTRIIGIALLWHIITDQMDCWMM